MKLHLNHPTSSLQITAFSEQNGQLEVAIGDTTYKSSLILTPRQIEMWEVQQVDQLTQAHFEALSKIDCEVILLGTGKQCVFPNMALIEPLMKTGIGLEVMDTAAACRTHAALTADGRLVTAALIL